MGRGKGKGSQYERDMCRVLSTWWNGQDDTFWKTQGSGNRATVRAKAGKRTRGQYGDVCAVDHRGVKLLKICIISIKRGYAGCAISDLLDQSWTFGEPLFSTWIREAIRDQQSAGVPFWMIITKRDKREAMVFMPWEFRAYIATACLGKFIPHPTIQATVPVALEPYNRHQVRLHKKDPKRFKKKYKVINQSIFGCTLKDFLSMTKRKDFKQVLKRLQIKGIV